jgi:hypothetical protein
VGTETFGPKKLLLFTSKGTMSRDFLPLVFFIKQLPLGPLG